MLVGFVAGGRLGRDLKDAGFDVPGNLQRPAQRRPGARPSQQQLRRRRGHFEPGRRAERVVQLLAGRQLEDDVEAHRARAYLARRPLGAVPRAGDRDRARGEPGQPVRGGLHHQHVPRLGQQHVTRLGQPTRDRGHRAGRRVVPPDRAVVRVRDQDRAVRQRPDAERVLQQRLVGRPVHLAEVEQSLADRGVHGPAFDPPQRAGLTVHEPQSTVPCGQSGRLGQPRLRERTVAQRLDRRARVRPGRPRHRIEPPELMDAGHGDDHAVVVPGDVPRRGQVDRERVVRREVDRRPPWPSAAGDRAHLAGGQVYPTQQVVDRVGDDHVVPGQLGDAVGGPAQPVRFAELRDRRRTVRPAGPSPSDAPCGGVAVHLHERVVRGVGDQDRAAGQGERLCGVPQLGRRYRRRDVRPVPAVQRALRLVQHHEVVDQPGQRLRVPLAGHGRDEVPLRVHHGERGPRLGRVLPPHVQVGVVQHGVADAVPLDRVGEGGRVLLVLELRRVHPDDDQDVGVPLLDRAQLVQDVQAVDAAERPEVQQDDLAAQVGEGEAPRSGVEPRPAA